MVPHCRETMQGPKKPFCIAHWALIPEDLHERLRYGVEDSDDRMDFQAAIQAAIAEMR